MPGALGKPAGRRSLAFPRRYRSIFAVSLILLTVIYLISAISAPSTVPVPSSLRDRLPDHLVPNILGPPSHKPPVQTNSSDGEMKWHADHRWLQAFSIDVTHDEERVVLPPLLFRPVIYTYYEANKKKSKDILNEEDNLLTQWRRAWWAQGFKPIVLGPGDALKNPLYKKVQMLNLEDNIEQELTRWLAWGRMGSGILADSRLLPMAPHENSLLAFLRRGTYPQLSRYEGLKAGLFCGEKTAINQFIEKAIANPEVKKALNFADPMFSEMFRIETTHHGVAYYDRETISKLYPVVSDPLFGDEELHGLHILGELINAHLQNTWQSAFTDVAVLKPLAKYTTALVQPALWLAGNLTSCPPIDPALLRYCPPNRSKCKPCISSTPIPITTPSSIRNKTSRYYIATVPHPWTLTALLHDRVKVDQAFVRRLGFSERDQYLKQITKDSHVGTSEAQLGVLKSSVASEWAAPRTLWVTAEGAGIMNEDLPWIFGFKINSNSGVDIRASAQSETPVPGKERRPPPINLEEEGHGALGDDALAKEEWVISQSRAAVRSQNRNTVRQRFAVEGFNLGDVEAWRFVRAFAARRRMVRRQFEKEESGFAGAERKSGWGRWMD